MVSEDIIVQGAEEAVNKLKEPCYDEKGDYDRNQYKETCKESPLEGSTYRNYSLTCQP